MFMTPDSLVTSSHPCLSVLAISLSMTLPLDCLHTRHTHGTGTRQSARGVFFFNGYGTWSVFLSFTFRLMVDVRRSAAHELL